MVIERIHAGQNILISEQIMWLPIYVHRKNFEVPKKLDKSKNNFVWTMKIIIVCKFKLIARVS